MRLTLLAYDVMETHIYLTITFWAEENDERPATPLHQGVFQVPLPDGSSDWGSSEVLAFLGEALIAAAYE